MNTVIMNNRTRTLAILNYESCDRIPLVHFGYWAETGEALVLRLYNPSEEETEAVIQLPFIPAGVRLVGLDENPRPTSGTETNPVHEAGGLVHVAVAPKKVITLRIERK